MLYEALLLRRSPDVTGLKGASQRWDASFLFLIARVFPLLIVFAAFSCISSLAYAHKVNMFAYVEGNKVIMEGYFADGNKPMNCEVVVTDPNKKVLVKGLTDHEGKFSFDIPEITDLRIVLNAGMGHRTEFVISRSELAGVKPVRADTASVPEVAEVEVAEPAEQSPENVSVSSTISEAMVRKAIADANLPLMRAVEELKEQASFSNIVGGIGFIVGLVGVFFYIKARKMLGQSATQSAAVK